MNIALGSTCLGSGVSRDMRRHTRDLLTGKSDEIGRSHGFFVYVYGRLLNVDDGHFGISPDELRHGTFGRFRLVVHMDGLDEGLRSNREAVGEGPLLDMAQDVLRAIFNAVRPTIEAHDSDEAPGAEVGSHTRGQPGQLVPPTNRRSFSSCCDREEQVPLFDSSGV